MVWGTKDIAALWTFLEGVVEGGWPEAPRPTDGGRPRERTRIGSDKPWVVIGDGIEAIIGS